MGHSKNIFTTVRRGFRLPHRTTPLRCSFHSASMLSTYSRMDRCLSATTKVHFSYEQNPTLTKIIRWSPRRWQQDYHPHRPSADHRPVQLLLRFDDLFSANEFFRSLGNIFAGGNVPAAFRSFRNDHVCNSFCRDYKLTPLSHFVPTRHED